MKRDVDNNRAQRSRTSRRATAMVRSTRRGGERNRNWLVSTCHSGAIATTCYALTDLQKTGHGFADAGGNLVAHDEQRAYMQGVGFQKFQIGASARVSGTLFSVEAELSDVGCVMFDFHVMKGIV